MTRADLGGITFGTDGWRDIIAEGFTVERVRWVAQACADWLKSVKPPKSRVLIGYDGRFGGERFALAAGEVFAGNGFLVDVVSRPVPTPAVSWWIMDRGCAGGLMITASHNPPAYSGIKVKPDYGGSADETIIAPIVDNLGRHRPRTGPASAIRRIEINVPYWKMLRTFLDFKSLRRLKGTLVFDPMGGAQAGLLAPILRGTALKVAPIHDWVDPSFCGLSSPEPVARNLGPLMKEVVRWRAIVGVATDGDGDRVGIVSEKGEFLTPHAVFALLVLHMIRNRGETGAIVKTVSGSFLIDRIAEAYGLRLLETPVGFKHICRLMRENDVMIGGEESGGIGIKGYLPERDGLMSALLFLELMAKTGKSCSGLGQALIREYGASCYLRTDARHPKAQMVLKKLLASPPSRLIGERIAKVNDRDGLKLILPDDSWLLFRASGTEPLLRIYAESGSRSRTKRLLTAGAALCGVRKG